MPRMKTDHAGPLIAQLHAWQDEQNPLVRAFSESLVEMVTQALLQMQAVIDQQALVIEQLREENESLRREHAVALQVTKDRIDQLERELYGKKSERRPRTPDAKREARQRRGRNSRKRRSGPSEKPPPKSARSSSRSSAPRRCSSRCRDPKAKRPREGRCRRSSR